MEKPMMDCERKQPKDEMPVFNQIYERLNSAINVSEKIAFETKQRLRTLKIEFVEHDPEPHRNPECFVDDILNLLSRMEDINRVSEANLRHLETII